MLPTLLGFIGGTMYTDSERGRWVQTGIFAGAGVSVFCWKGRAKKVVFRDAGLGVAGALLGILVKNQIKRR